VNTFGFDARLRAWRKRRGISQIELSGRAEISQRHLSFLELGRASPSRDMVLRLAAALDVPLREQNALLVSAGFAPVWRETDLQAPELSQVRDAVAHILDQQEPFPAVVVDRRWTLLQANRGAVCLVEFLVGRLVPGASINLADALVAPDVLRPYLTNWKEVAAHFIRSVEADAVADGRRKPVNSYGACAPTPEWPQSNGCPGRPQPSLCFRCTFGRGTRRLAYSPRLQRWAHRRTLRCRNSGSNSSSQWMH
jgi:transcriptional regulator with XRE-family HTH domain